MQTGQACLGRKSRPKSPSSPGFADLVACHALWHGSASQALGSLGSQRVSGLPAKPWGTRGANEWNSNDWFPGKCFNSQGFV